MVDFSTYFSTLLLLLSSTPISLRDALASFIPS
jgi:hypothetical protein